MPPLPIRFRYSPKNSYSIAALMPLVEAGLSRQPESGIMLYSFATARQRGYTPRWTGTVTPELRKP